MSRSRLWAVLVATGGGLWLLGAGCSSADSKDGDPIYNSTAGTSGSGTGGSNVVETTPPGQGGSDHDAIHPLCGPDFGSCTPDDAGSCLGYLPPSEAGDGGGAGGEGMGGAGSGGESLVSEGGAGAGAGGDSSAFGGQPAAGFGGESLGGMGGAPVEKPPRLASYSCQVARQNNQLVRQCTRAGSGGAKAPCFGAEDCAPGLACVTEGDAARCLPYCCDLKGSCTEGTYCAERSLRKAAADVSNSEPPRVPVCVPADGCSLEDEYPCPAGEQCRCQGNTACMVVRDDGTTTCLVPGAGKQGDACPCAWNHVCSSVTHQCVKLCRTEPGRSDCGAQKCQASAELPNGFGVCVGPR
jgi:hypothetical protein